MRHFVADAASDDSLAQDVVRRTGPVSMLFEPILRAGTPIGVLSVGWDRRVSDLGQPTTEAVALLAVEAAVAIERANLHG